MLFSKVLRLVFSSSWFVPHHVSRGPKGSVGRSLWHGDWTAEPGKGEGGGGKFARSEGEGEILAGLA